jgi:hypothetical protein
VKLWILRELLVEGPPPLKPEIVELPAKPFREVFHPLFQIVIGGGSGNQSPGAGRRGREMAPDVTDPHKQDEDADKGSDAVGSPQAQAAFVAVFLSLKGGGAAPGAAVAGGAAGAFQQLAAALTESVLFPMNQLALVTVRAIFPLQSKVSS